MKYTSIYKNGKPEYFFIMIDNKKEFELLRPYFLMTDSEHKRNGSITWMECLHSGVEWYGKQRHGYGYSSSHDVYCQLIDNVYKLYRKQLTDEAKKALADINTHNDEIVIPEFVLDELNPLNDETFKVKFNVKF